MKKSICKHISLLLTVMLILSVSPASVMAEEHTVSATGTTRIEGEDYVGATHASIEAGDINASAKGAKIMNVPETTQTKYTTSYKLSVAVAGYYDIKAAGSLRQDNLSAWTIYVNNSSNELSTYTAAGELFRVNGIGPNAGAVYDCGRIYLAAGENTLYWCFGKAKSQNSLYAALDYIELSPSPTIPVSATEFTKIEGEDYTGATVEPNIRKMNDPDDGQSAVNYVSFIPANHSGKEFIIGYTLNAAAEGDYKLDAVATVRSETYTSDWSFYVNTAENSVSTYKKGEDITTTKFMKGLFKRYDCGTVHLNAGANILYWKVKETDLGEDGKSLQAALDYFVLTPAIGLTNPVLKVDEKLKKGENAVISVINGDSNEFGIGLFTNVSVTADDARIVIWQDNKLFAANCGKTMITVSLTDMKGKEHELKKEITVVSEEGIWISDASYSENGDIEVKISALEDYADGDKVIAVVYDTVEGTPTSLISANDSTIPYISEGSTQIVTVNIGSVSGTQKVAIFILSGSNNNKAIYSKYVIGGEL
ncbi:MAG: hypothetical protein IK057_05555 [Clostridia bacterium]|nr:hypothetical protein [Clostridia bacterium]